MHLAAASASSGVAGVQEIIAYTCVAGAPCNWSLSLAMECAPGDVGMAVVTTADLTVPGQKGQPASFVQCGGPNPGLPGTYVYGIQRTDIFNQLVQLNRPLVLRLSQAKGNRMRDVRLDFAGAAPVIARVNANHQAKYAMPC